MLMASGLRPPGRSQITSSRRSRPTSNDYSPPDRSLSAARAQEKQRRPEAVRYGQIIVRALKYHAFGDGNVRLTRKRCERFFEEDANFLRLAARLVREEKE